MKSYNVLVVFVVLFVVGHEQSRTVSGNSVFAPTGHDVDPRCSHDGTNITTASLLKKKLTCFESLSSLKLPFLTASVTPKYRTVVQRACARAPPVRTCMDGIYSEATTCLSDMEVKLFKATRKNADVLFSAVCDDGGDSVARMMGVEFKQLMRENKMSEARECLATAKAGVQFNDEVDLSAYTMRKYRALKEVRKCIVDVALEAHVKTTNLEKFCDKLARGMKCISPVTKEIVLCSSLEEDRID